MIRDISSEDDVQTLEEIKEAFLSKDRKITRRAKAFNLI